MIDESEFHKKADALLERIFNEIEEKDSEMAIDADLNQGILTLELDSGQEYIINKHSASSQVWLSSPISGGLHYNYNPANDGWELTKDGSRLSELLSEELYKLTSIAFDFIRD